MKYPLEKYSSMYGTFFFVTIPVPIGGIPSYGSFIIDTGSNLSTLDSRFAERNRLPLTGILMERLQSPGGGKLKTQFTDVKLFSKTYRLHVADYSKEKWFSEECDGIIGLDLLQRWKATIDLSKMELRLKTKN